MRALGIKLRGIFLLYAYAFPLVTDSVYSYSPLSTEREANHGNQPLCEAPTLDTEVMPKSLCSVLRRACFQQGEIVSFDPDHVVSYDPGTNRSVLRPPINYLPQWGASWNIPGNINSDAIVGNQDAYRPVIRPASRLESSPALRRPVFSSCTLPVVLFADWPFNFCEFFTNGASGADYLFRQQQMLPDLNATLVLALPAGLGLSTFHHALLGHLSRRPIMTLDKVAAEAEAAAWAEVASGGGGQGSGGHDGGGVQGPQRVAWSYEGVPVACFERVVVCKLSGRDRDSPIATAAAVVRHLELTHGPLPADPLGFGAASAAAAGAGGADGGSGGAGDGGGGPQQSPTSAAEYDTTLRVAIEVRHGSVRTIRNVHHIISACESLHWPDGPFRRVSCRPLVTDDTPAASGMDRFRATVAAVRSAHVLVAVHGAGAANGFFLRTDLGAAAAAASGGGGGGGGGGDGGGGGARTATAVLEVRPCGFGSGFTWWVDVHMAISLPRLGDSIHFHAYNLEDPAQCSPAEWSLAARAAGGAANTRAGNGHHLRDQHVTLRPDGFFAMLRHVAGLLRDPAAYDAAKKANRLHGYALPGEEAAAVTPGEAEGGGGRGDGGRERVWGKCGGVVLGPLGVEKLETLKAAGAEYILQPG